MMTINKALTIVIAGAQRSQDNDAAMGHFVPQEIEALSILTNFLARRTK